MAIAGYAPRLAAYRVLLEQERKSCFLKDLLPHVFSKLQQAEDRALTQEIAYGCIRNRSLLDFNLKALTGQKEGKSGLRIKKPVRVILRVGLYQILLMSGIPGHAAVSTSVEIAKRELGPKQASFVNGVLKNAAKQGLMKRVGRKMEALATNYSHPEWLVERWRQRLEGVQLEQRLRQNSLPPVTWIRFNPTKANRKDAQRWMENLAQSVRKIGCEIHLDSKITPFAQVSGKSSALLRSSLFLGGWISFQDPAAFWVCRLLAWTGEAPLLDVCSAPGGKAACSLELVAWDQMQVGNEDWRAVVPKPETDKKPTVICCDISLPRLKRIGDSIHRLGHTNLCRLAANGTSPPFRSQFDTILLDVPCSNLGVLARRPESRWNVTENSLQEHATKQLALLTSAESLASKRGAILYTTCSCEPEETTQVISQFLQANPHWKIDPAQNYVPSQYVTDNCISLLNPEHGYDGFFACRLVRNESSPR